MMNPFDEYKTADAAPKSLNDYYDFPVDGQIGDTSSVKEKKPDKGKIKIRIRKKGK